MGLEDIATPNTPLQTALGKVLCCLRLILSQCLTCRDVGAYFVLGFSSLHHPLFGGGDFPCCRPARFLEEKVEGFDSVSLPVVRACSAPICGGSCE